MKKCPVCLGATLVKTVVLKPVTTPCSYCKGKGTRLSYKCPDCLGSGTETIYKQETDMIACTFCRGDGEVPDWAG